MSFEHPVYNLGWVKSFARDDLKKQTFRETYEVEHVRAQCGMWGP